MYVEKIANTEVRKWAKDKWKVEKAERPLEKSFSMAKEASPDAGDDNKGWEDKEVLNIH